MAKGTMRLSYDKASDVLYISFGTPKRGIDEETEIGVFIRRDEKTHQIIGATVMDFEKRFSGKLDEVLPITLEDITQIPA